MAARKDDGQEPPASGRPGVIWRLPATRGAAQDADTPDAPAAEAEADRPKGRRVPLLATIGLAAALVCVGLYAAWSEFGSDVFGIGGEESVASAPAAAPPVAEQTGDGPSGEGTATSPPADGASAPPRRRRCGRRGLQGRPFRRCGIGHRPAGRRARPTGDRHARAGSACSGSPGAIAGACRRRPAGDSGRCPRHTPRSRSCPRARPPLLPKQLRLRSTSPSLPPGRPRKPISAATRSARSTPGWMPWRRGPMVPSALALR